MSKTSLRIMFINLENLFSPGIRFYRSEYTEEEYTQKINWIGSRIAEGQAHVVALSELGEDPEQCIQDLMAAANRHDSPLWQKNWGAFRFEFRAEPGLHGAKIRTAVISRFPLTDTESIRDFPEDFRVDLFPQDQDEDDDADAEKWKVVPIFHFSRPIAKVTVNPPSKTPFNVFVVHLKSKRPKTAKHDGENEAIGIARSAVQRNVEAAALRYYMDDFLPNQYETDERVPTFVIGDFNDTTNSVPLENIRGPFDKVPGPASTWSEPDKRRLLRCARLHVKESAYDDKLFSYVFNESFTLLDQALVTQHLAGRFKRFEVYNDHVLRHSEIATSTAQDKQWKTTISDHGIIVIEFVRML